MVIKEMSNKDLYKIQSEIQAQVHYQLMRYIDMFYEDSIDSWVVPQMMEILKKMNYGNYILSKFQRAILDDIAEDKKPSFTDCISVWFQTEYKEIRTDEKFKGVTKTNICKALYEVVNIEGYKDVEYELSKRLLK